MRCHLWLRKVPHNSLFSSQHNAVLDDNQFVIIASDGLWNVFQDQETVDFVTKGLDRGDDPRTCAALLVSEAVSVRGTTDDTAE